MSAWPDVKLNDGNTIPGLAFGSATRRSEGAPPKTVAHIVAALQAGIRHLDTAQQYGNERDVGEALRQSGIPREEVCITTKWSDGDVTPHEACEASLKALGTSYIDVYVIHHTWTCKEDFAGAWRQMEEIRKAGLVRSIGLSAFGHEELEKILAAGGTTPAVNMIMFNPDVLESTEQLLDLMKKHKIAIGGYSCLKPLWTESASSAAVRTVAKQRNVPPESVLLKWAQQKSAVVYTSTTTPSRIPQYLSAGAIELSSGDVALIDHAVKAP